MGERAKEYTADFSEIQDLLTRYETLEAAHRDLVRNQAHFESKNEEVRQEFQNYQKESANEILGFTTKTASLQSELEASETLRQQLTLEAEEVTQGDSEQSLFLGKIIMSVENLYLRCTSERPTIQHASELEGGPSSNDEDVGDAEDSPAEKAQVAIRQLGVIMAYLKDFKEIYDQVKKERRQQEAGGQRAGLILEDDKLPEPYFEYHDVPRGAQGGGSSEADASKSGALKTTTDLGVSRRVDSS